jgi:hypothetical protein
LRRSRRPLPEADASVDEIAAEDRDLLYIGWAGRADSELGAAQSFAVIARALRDDGAAPDLVALAERAIEDEKYHSQICHRMASIYLGKPAPRPNARAHAVPRHPGASDELRRTLHIVGQCALNETTGSAFYEMCLSHAHTGPARTALLALLSDEVDHARIGWAHLASLSGARRRELGRWLPTLIESNLRSWRQQRGMLPSRPALTAHGCPSFEDGDRTVVAALRDLVVPGLALHGFDVRAVADLALARVERPAPRRTLRLVG